MTLTYCRRKHVRISVTCANLHNKTQNYKLSLSRSYFKPIFLYPMLLLYNFSSIHILNFIFIIGHLFMTYIVTLYLPISKIPEYLMLRQMIKTFLSSKDNLLQQTSFLELEFTTCFLGVNFIFWTVRHSILEPLDI